MVAILVLFSLEDCVGAENTKEVIFKNNIFELLSDRAEGPSGSEPAIHWEGRTLAWDAVERATALVNAVATMDLDTIVVGGGVINAADVYWRPLQHHFETQLEFLNFPSTVSLTRSTLGKNSGLIGAGLVGFISVDQREGAL